MFHVGQKVVCVDASPNAGYIPIAIYLSRPWIHVPDMDGLRRDGVYTIRRIFMLYGVEHCWLHELVRPLNPDGEEAGFALARFRPLTDTSISDVLAKTAPKDSHRWDNRRKVKEKVS